MTMGNYGLIWCINHCYPLAKCKLIDKKDFHRYINWVNLRPMFANENNSKGSKIEHRLYLMQKFDSKIFLKLNDTEE